MDEADGFGELVGGGWAFGGEAFGVATECGGTFIDGAFCDIGEGCLAFGGEAGVEVGEGAGAFGRGELFDGVAALFGEVVAEVFDGVGELARGIGKSAGVVGEC